MSNENSPLSIYDYMISYGSALKALNAEQAYFDSISSNAMVSQSERAYAVAGSTGIASDIGLLKAAHEAFMLKFQGGVNPPSQEVLKKSQELTAALAAQLHSTAQAVVALNIVTTFIADWNTLSAPAKAAGTTTNSAAWLDSHTAV